MSVGLLDANVLIALAWPSHVHHERAHDWFDRHQANGWATCPLTQCAFVRASSNSKIIDEAVSPQEALGLLTELVAHDSHEFWADDLPLTDAAMPTELLVGHRQVTDSYLLGLAMRRSGRLVTFDRGIQHLLERARKDDGFLELIASA